MLDDLVEEQTALEIIETGEFYPPEETLRMGLVDTVLPLEEVADASIKEAAALASRPGNVFTMRKRRRVAVVAAQVRARLEEDNQHFVDCWYATKTRDLLREAMAKF